MTLNGAVYAGFLSALGEYDLTDHLPAMHTPALVMACPVPFTTAMGLSVAETLRNVETIVLNHCGHLPWLEAPDRFFPALRRFLGSVHPTKTLPRLVRTSEV